jgi:hypothetical protein
MKLFLSYSTPDARRARLVYSALRGEGWSVWFDEESLLPGMNWAREIDRAIKASDIVVLLLSSKSFERRGFFQRELREALSVMATIPPGQIYLVPARLDECPIPDDIKPIQWVNLFPSFEAGLRKLIDAIRFQGASGKSASVRSSTAEAYANVASLNDYIAKNVNIATVEKRRNPWNNYSLLHEEFQGDETLQILWDNRAQRLLKYYRSNNEVRWDGPHELGNYEIEKVRRLIGLGG